MKYPMNLQRFCGASKHELKTMTKKLISLGYTTQYTGSVAYPCDNVTCEQIINFQRKEVNKSRPKGRGVHTCTKLCESRNQ